MDAKELKSRLSTNDIIKIIKSLGGEIWFEDEDKIILNTICHGGDSPNKLYYLKEEKYFYCYTHCGITDILSIVCQVKDYTLPQSISYICTLLHISTMQEGFTNNKNDIIEDWGFINSFRRRYKNLEKKNEKKQVSILDHNLLNMFQEIYTTEWMNDGISKGVMKKYNILYSTYKQSIIIPHYDVNNDLIGIRQRAMLEEDITAFGKYTPFSICGEMYNHPLSNNLYGLNVNKETIKRTKKVMLVESEKGVLQAASMFGIENNFTVALCGCAKVSNIQRQLLMDLGVNKVIIALDRQYEERGSDEYYKWIKHIKDKFINPLIPYFNIYILWDTEDDLGYKDSPTDKGIDILLKLMNNKIYIEG